MSSQIKRCGYVGIVGPANAGKSTLLNALVGRKVSIVSPKVQTTRSRVLGIKNLAEAQLIFIDTPGFLRKEHPGELTNYLNEALQQTLGELDVCLLVLDAASLLKKAGVSAELKELWQSRRYPAPDVLALNKVDLVAKGDLLPLIQELHTVFGEGRDKPLDIIPLSALKADGLETLTVEVAKRLPEGPALFPEPWVTDQPDEKIAAEIVREKLFFQLQDELPYSAAVLVDQFYEEREMYFVEGRILVERESQKGIVVGKKGERIKAIGTSARHELEMVFGRKVMLKLQVYVEPDWAQTRHGLERAGYDR
jgi:GTPase